MKSVLVVEGAQGSVRVALSRDGQVHALHALPLAGAEPAGEALRTWLAASKAKAAAVISVIPREQVITRVVKFPTSNPQELSQMIELYARAQLPYPREQSIVDCSVLAQQDGFSVVAIVACQEEVGKRQLALCGSAGLTPSMLTVSSWGVLGWYRAQSRSEPLAEPCLVVNVDEHRTDFVLIRSGALLLSRAVGQGAGDWEGAGDVPTLLAAEAERSRAAARKELPGTEIRSLLLAGVGAVSEWRDALARQTGLPVSVASASPAAPSGSAAWSPVVVQGLALSDLTHLLNLSPSKLRGQIRHRRQVRDLTTISSLVAGVLLLGAMLLGFQLVRQSRLAGRLDRALHTTAASARTVREQQRSVELVTAVLEERKRLARALAGIFRQTPSTVTLEGLGFEQARGELTLRGLAGSNQEVLAYRKALEGVEGVARVDLKYSMQRAGRVSFELALRLGAAPHPPRAGSS